MDSFFTSVEVREKPELRGLPFVVGADPEGGKGRGVVSTNSYEARKFGIHSAILPHRLISYVQMLPLYL
jgi:DNA polymerase IV (archaeal DinB-like DNA polymerase)